MHAHSQNAVRQQQSSRRGYALPIALLFVVLFTTMLGVAWRGMASAIRLQSVRTIQIQRDQGSIQALALAMHLLETGLPPSDPYACAAIVSTSDGLREYAVTFIGEGGPYWLVRSAPLQADESLSPMPDTFADEDEE